MSTPGATLSPTTDPAATGAAAIEVRGVAKRYGTRDAVVALDGVDLTVRQGEFVCLVGPSGCGKSTLLRMMAGLHRPSEGEVLVHHDGTGRTPTAMVFQDYGIFPWKSVRANVRFGLDVAGVPRAEATRTVDSWLSRLGLADFADAYPATLSGGMRQRVSIARALAVEPEVLLLDEPFAALDAQLRTVLQEELLALWQADRRTVVFVTHSLEEAILLGDRVVVMSARPGRILADLPVPLPRPRSAETRGEPAFAALEQQLWSLLRDEVSRTFDGGSPA
ncbi:ABC transporter ATP-binding protein [Pimelobacter simplex]|uniref:ABC transporter ATP-binding protein n=1 Tax=Nocardioides simplex TaxID=2045 RepID=A0A7J5DX37_NOCSI|nr:ABC transporter ATP-binding protein [Pimelobacter simplex]KAB2810438.1 ABC transporter ATP-binding protein [Pimelobacter simplex]